MPHNKLATQLNDSPAYELAVALAVAGGDSWQRGGWRRWPLRQQPVTGRKRCAGRGASSPHPSVTYVPWAGSVSGQDLMPHNKLASKLRVN